jgi:hypothetical protein
MVIPHKIRMMVRPAAPLAELKNFARLLRLTVLHLSRKEPGEPRQYWGCDHWQT